MRTDFNINSDWKYHRGYIENCYDRGFDDNDWKRINLPHNTSLYTQDNKNAYQGISIYRKKLCFDSSYKDKIIFLTFDGVMQRCKVYLNGKEIAENNNGYIPFCIDVSNVLEYINDNVLAIVTDSRPSMDFTPGKSNPDFQYFGGIYRNVHITVTDKTYITNPVAENTAASGGVFITAPVVSQSSAVVNIKTEIKNSSNIINNLELRTSIIYGDRVIKKNSEIKNCRQNEKTVFDNNIKIENPLLWSPYTPYLYDIKCSLYIDGKLIDEVTTKYGIRKIEWTHQGLYINDKQFKAQGANLHSDIFVLGNAIPDNEVFEEIKRLKENGFDFIRMSHYPHSESYYDACDKYGVLVLNCMSGWQNFSDKKTFKQSTYEELKVMIRLSRNHPSIVAWETSLNESNYTEEWAKEVQKIAHKEYPTNGISRMWTTGWITDEFDILLGASQHDIRTIADKSDKGVIISEYGDWDYGGTLSTSRVKREGNDNDLLTQASNHIESAILTRAKSWFSADALWCYDDYSGSDPIMNYSGIVDMYRFNKYSAYFYRSQRNPNIDMNQFGVKTGPMIFVANSLGDDSPEDVTVFSNCDEVELFADGKNLGKQTPNTEYFGNNSKKALSTKSLPHPPFVFHSANKNNTLEELVAIGYINGKKYATHKIKKQKFVTTIILTPESEQPICANGSDLKLIWVSITDNNGTVVKNHDRTISFDVHNGYIVGTESVKTISGQNAIWVRAYSSTTDCALTITAFSKGLKENSVKIDVVGDKNASNYIGENEYKYINAYSKYDKEKDAKKDDIVFDVAREKKAYSSSNAKGCLAEYGNNGEPSTYWYPATTDENWWYVDTGNTYSFERIEITWNEQEAHTFVVETSIDAKNWTKVLSIENKIEHQTVERFNGQGRYVRIKFKSISNNAQGFNMFYVYGKKQRG